MPQAAKGYSGLRMKNWFGLVMLLIATFPACAQDAPPANARLVSFPSPDGTLYGFFYVPEGKGPFPAVLWNHGSEPHPGWQPHLASFYNAHGLVFFIPHRHGQGGSPGLYIMDEIRRNGGPLAAVHAQQTANEDVVAAMNWLRAQPEVDPRLALWCRDVPCEAFRPS